VSDDTQRVLVEACCDSVHTARAAQAFGAGRVELCGPGDGGTTPSFGLIARCRDELQIPLHVMIRPHTNSFLYGDDDVDVMGNDIIAARARGADGIVLGPLHPDGTIHQEQLVVFIALARPMKVVFHRAFDRTPSTTDAMSVLLNVGIDGVLTSGHAATAVEGAETLRVMQRRAGRSLTILAGGSVRGTNVLGLVSRTGVREVHARGTDPVIIRDLVGALTALPDDFSSTHS
jgi:copper homeostasis protein